MTRRKRTIEEKKALVEACYEHLVALEQSLSEAIPEVWYREYANERNLKRPHRSPRVAATFYQVAGLLEGPRSLIEVMLEVTEREEENG